MAPFVKAQAETTNDNTPLLLGDLKYFDRATIARDVNLDEDVTDGTLMALVASTNKWVPLRDVDPAGTAGYMTCGAFGSTAKAVAAISDGSFKVQIDGEDAVSVTGLDFRKVKSIGDLPASCVCGVNGALITAWDDLADGQFKIDINGTVRTINVDCDTVPVTTLDEVGQVINRAVAPYGARCEYDRGTNKFAFFTVDTGSKQTIGPLTAGTAGTDISGSGWLNGLTGVATVTAGSGGEDTGLTIADVINANATFAATGARCEFTGAAFRFISPTLGVNSAVSVLTAGASGTDISGSGYLNGLTGTGTATAGTGLDGSHVPRGIYRGGTITHEAIQAADVKGDIVVGNNVTVNEDNLVLQNSLTLEDVIPALGCTIRAALRDRGFYCRSANAADATL